MLMITEISPTSINKYFNREFIIVATSVSLAFEGNARVSKVRVAYGMDLIQYW